VVIGVTLWLAFSAASVSADDGNSPEVNSPISADLSVNPTAVLPGEPLTFTLTLSNSAPLAQHIIISSTLPVGFELPLSSLPAGSVYNIRTRNIQWRGQLEALDHRMLLFPGTTPSESLDDGRLTFYVALTHQAQSEGESADNDHALSSHTRHLAATGWVGTSPTAAFEHADSGTSVEFANLSQGTGPISAWWDFGDGTTANEWAPVHRYPGNGDYTVQLTVANPKGANTITQTLLIDALPDPVEPTSPYQILVSDETPAVGQPVYFSNITEPISITVQWDFGDNITSSQVNPTHFYQHPGIYTVTRVLGEGETAIQSSQTLLVDYSPHATIQVARTSLSVGELVTLTALTSAPEVQSYYWDFGDGNLASNAYVAHSYSAPGIFPVTLAVSTDFGVALDTLTLRVASYAVYLPLVSDNIQPETVVEAEPTVEETEIPDLEPEGALAPPEEALAPPADPLAQEILQAINAEREAVGLPPLVWSDQLARSAQHHTDDMATYWFTGHYGSNGSRPVDRMRQASYTGDYAGECTAWGFDDIASAVAWWMTSPPHRVIILSTVATEIGGAYSHNPNAPSVHYWTIDFGAQ